MTILGKKQMSEEDIKLNYITPVILDGWKGHVTMETKITDGRINISGNIVARSKPKFADYMLYLNDGKPIAAVEAKDNNHSVWTLVSTAMRNELSRFSIRQDSLSLSFTTSIPIEEKMMGYRNDKKE